VTLSRIIRALDVAGQRCRAVLEAVDGMPVTQVAERYGSSLDGAQMGCPVPGWS